MLAQQFKNAYFAVNRWLVVPNQMVASWRYRQSPDPEGYYVHLGSGDHYIPGMINVEGNIMRRKDLWADLRNPLPFGDETCIFVYCCHTLEHFYPDEAIELLKEIRRVLREEGVARIAVPSLEHALDIAAGKVEKPWPRNFDDSQSQALNYLFCDGQHKYGYCLATLTQFAKEAGFSEVIPYSPEHGVEPKKYGRVEVGNEPAGSLIVELVR